MQRDYGDFESLNPEVKRVWDANASFWDQRMGDEGNDFHLELLRPAQERLLDLRPGEMVLDIACGNGQFARQMADAGARVVAFDLSAQQIEMARARSTAYEGRIEYEVLDATAEEDLRGLGSERFDAAVCTMALMDMTTIRPLISTLPALLRPGGRFVFSVMHPCFNSPLVAMVQEQHEREGRLASDHYLKVSGYLHPVAKMGESMVGQPQSQYYFHRPISVLLSACFDAGLVLDGLEEPVFSEDKPTKGGLAWEDFTGVPPVLVCRTRLPAVPA